MRRALMAILAMGLAVALGGCAGQAEQKVVFRVSAGAEKDYVDQAGAKWSADQEFKEGATYGAIGGRVIRRTTPKTVEGTMAPDVYLTERYMMTGYQFALPNGKYTVRLHFAETYEGVTKEGQRVFTVNIQGQPALTDLDVFKAAGGFAKPLTKELKGVVVKDGKLLIEFVKNLQSPEINGIEILTE